MNVLMLGNGFDLNYKLPTKYINFLNTVKYISESNLTDVKTVGDIWGAEELQQIDKDIAESYTQHQAVYDSAMLEQDVLNKLSELAKNNMLFSYLLNSFNRDVGWIDFEKEISVVLHAFQILLKNERPIFSKSKFSESKVDQYVISYFNFFYQIANQNIAIDTCRVNNEYIVTYPQGSNNRVIDKEKIISTLETELINLAEGLKIYLQCFVENVVKDMCKYKSLKPLPALTNAQLVVTFNYTSTYEQVYKGENVCHIHGNVKDRIILGINPDEADDISTVDTSFVRFKKYYQRVMHRSDVDYLEWVTREQQVISLLVMGHSLDVTDQDIIMQMFDAAKDITILYYSEQSQSALITNLIKMYGKLEFDALRVKKRLRFLPQDADYKGFAEDRQAKEMADKMKNIVQPVIF